MRRLLRIVGILSLAIAGLGGLAGPRAALAAGSSTLPASNGTLSGATRSYDLWAKSGTTNLPGYPALPVLGYTAAAATPVTAPGGPALVANQGETIQITLHNGLTAASALNIAGQPLAPDLTGAAPAGTKTYSFVASQPGTFLYEAGVRGGGPRQTVLGLYGALVVRPTGHADWAYGASSTFKSEALLVLSGVDPLFNQSPASFNMRGYAPKFWLINGGLFAGAAASIPAHRGGTLLLRQVNAGITHEPIGVLGLPQQVVGTDGRALARPYSAVSQTLGAGQTQDSLLTIDGATPLGRRYAVGNTANPSNGSGVLTFISAADLYPPVVSGLTLVPTPTNAVSVALAATADDSTAGNTGVASAEYRVDAGPWTLAALVGTAVSATISTAGLADGAHTVQLRATDGVGNVSAPLGASFTFDTTAPAVTNVTALPASVNGGATLTFSATATDATTTVNGVEYQLDGTAGSWTAFGGAPASTVSVSANLPAAGLSEGTHTLYIRASDVLGNTGGALFASASFVVDITGSVVTAGSLALTPATVVAGTSVALTAAATDNLTGVASAEYQVNGGAWTPATVTSGAIAATISTSGLPVGVGSVSLRSTDGVGNVGVAVTTPLTITTPLGDSIAPVVSAVGFALSTPNASGGTLTASATDNVAVTSANYRVDGGAWTSFTITAGPSVSLSASPSGLSSGSHTIEVQATDAATNVSALGSVTFVVDTIAPTISASVAPSPTNGAASVTLTGSASDGAGTGVASTQYRVDGGAWATFTLAGTSISTVGLTSASHTVDVRATDARGNVGSSSATFVVSANTTLFANGFEGGTTLPGAWTSVTGTTTGVSAKVTVTTAAALSGSNGLRVTAVNGSNGYVSRTIAAQTGIRARFKLNPNGATFDGNSVNVFRIRGAGNTTANVRLRLSSGVYQVQLQVQRSGGTSSTAWVALASGSNTVEVVWAKGGSTTASLIVNGAAQPNLTALNTNAFTADQLWLGLMGNGSGTGAVYLDDFASTSGSPIVP